MPHAVASDFGEGDLHATLLANDAAILHTLVLAAQALVILNRAEDSSAEQTIAFRLKRAIVDRLRLLDLAERPEWIRSGLAIEMRIWSKLCGPLTCPKIFINSFINDPFRKAS